MKNGNKEASQPRVKFAQWGVPTKPVGGNLIQPAVNSNPDGSGVNPASRMPRGTSGLPESQVRNPFKGK